MKVVNVKEEVGKYDQQVTHVTIELSGDIEDNVELISDLITGETLVDEDILNRQM